MNAVLERWTGLRLEDPWFLLAAALVAVALVQRRRRGPPALLFGPPVDGLPRTWRTRAASLPILLETAAALLLAVALARPVHRAPLPLRPEGIDMVVCLDVSSSMKATDMDEARTRLDVAREELRALVARRPNDRFGLVTFARYADVVCPLTLDHAAWTALLQDVRRVAEDGPEDRTGLGAAMVRGAELLAAPGTSSPSAAAAGAKRPSKVLLLVTDGEENVATAETKDEIGPLPAAQLLAGRGVKVVPIVVGVGRPGERGTWEPLDLEAVTEVAEHTGGRLLLARDASAMAEVTATIDRLERAPFSAPRFLVEERYAIFVALSIGAGLLAFVLRRSASGVLP